MQYYISQIDDPSITETGKFGDFRVVKYYNIYKTSKSTDLCEVDGIIVQKVTRTSHCGPFKDGSYLTTNDEIESFTNGHVLNSNISYYEYFVVKNGQSLDGDAFASGAITKYLLNFPFVLNLPYKNGETTYSAKSVFIHKDNDNFSKIINFNWDRNPSSPANGLPFIIESDESNMDFELLFSNKVKNKHKNSNIASHKLTATWSNDNQITQIIQKL
ncbi:hypothetical protein OAA60_05800 [Porticoccaceae bacterium]|jgi:hypothetical protein|nr:hypothetical protein [Porticoccaceae bacterium]